MWTCPACQLTFNRTNQVHSCNDRTLDSFLNGKSQATSDLFWHFIEAYRDIGEFQVHPTKSMISLTNGVRFAYVMRLGKNFVDVMFPFEQPYEDNECFYRIGSVPGANQFNHYCRLVNKDDVNAELKKYMRIAMEFRVGQVGTS